jgi:hypothetical protein
MDPCQCQTVYNGTQLEELVNFLSGWGALDLWLRLRVDMREIKLGIKSV